MANNKDFLSQFSTNNKPDSFKEEERIKVDKPKKTINPKIIIIGVIALIVIAAVVFLLFFMPKIKVEDFTGAKKEDAIAWIKQQGIETSGIIFKDEYNFDNNSGIILSQEPTSGKVRENAKMTFIVSKGPDPDESIKVPDLKSMDKDEITNWISTNKLLSTKLNTTYSEEVEKDAFIKADYSGCDEDTFTRGCSLKISISKGAKPQEEITMANFVKKSFAEFEAWATPKKIKLNKTEAYSDTVDLGLIISQSIKEGEKVVAGAEVNVVVSKGKAVYAKDFVGEEQSEVIYWASKNGVYLITKEQYSNDYSKGDVISQSIEKGKIVTDEFTIVVSLGNPVFTGTTYRELKAWINEVNEKGANLSRAEKQYVNSDTVPVGELISYGSTYCGSTLHPVISAGKNLLLHDDITNGLYWTDVLTVPFNESKIRTLCKANEGVSCVFEYSNTNDEASPRNISEVLSIRRSDDNSVPQAGTYISQNVDIIVTIFEGTVSN